MLIAVLFLGGLGLCDRGNDDDNDNVDRVTNDAVMLASMLVVQLVLVLAFSGSGWQL